MTIDSNCASVNNDGDLLSCASGYSVSEDGLSCEEDPECGGPTEYRGVDGTCLDCTDLHENCTSVSGDGFIQSCSGGQVV